MRKTDIGLIIISLPNGLIHAGLIIAYLCGAHGFAEFWSVTMMAPLIFALDAGIFISVVVRLLTERKEKKRLILRQLQHECKV
ncbi:hypothetical protein [Pantoea ananatis]|uniref:hypothetical protein n=1 Tax=Pantoea ananas TaxID=553 RepID=UPI001B3070B2|nr:hypothetical protein [Pantoea ananatis]